MQGRHEQGHQQPPQSCVGKYYDFIEVGSADWGTLTHYCAKDKHSASPAGEEIWSSLDDLRWVRGIAVDPISEHLQALPDLPQVQKVEAAMDEWSGQDNFWYVSAQNIKAHKGAYWAYFSEDWWSWKVDVMHYAGSLGSLGTPHPNLDFMLRNIGRSDLLEKRIIQVLDWSTLCSRYHVRKVDVVQLDCEGKDCAILRGMLKYCDRKPLALPRILQFEANHLTPEEEILDTLQSLAQRGFTLRYRTTNNIMHVALPEACRIAPGGNNDCPHTTHVVNHWPVCHH